jgi:tetraprenyl-beta-curcumene synthase
MVQACREALEPLPSRRQVRPLALAAIKRMIDYQRLTHRPGAAGRVAMRRWAESLADELGTTGDLSWWETAAGAASSLSVFALIAAAARPNTDERDAAALERAYFPDLGALHVLLDSLIDHEGDLHSGHHSLIAHYPSRVETAERLGAIAARARRAAIALPDGLRHELILGAMVAFYLSDPAAASGGTLAARRVLGAIGRPAANAMTVLRVRRRLSAMRPQIETQVLDFPLVPASPPEA